MIRHLDSLGRVVIPKEHRKELGWNEDDKIIIERKGNSILLKKYKTITCTNCKTEQPYKNTYCYECGTKLRKEK